MDSSTQRRALSVAMSHLTAKEFAKVDEMQKGGWDAGEILDSLQKMRSKAGEPGPSQSAVYRAMSGETYKRDYFEQRGRPTALPFNSQVTVRSQSGHSQVYSQVTVRSCKNQ